MSKRLKISQHLQLSPDRLFILSDFCKFCIEDLQLFGNVEISVVSDRSLHGIETTAYYVPTRGRTCVYGKNRALVDICRSIAHELAHMKQDQEGLLDGPVQNVGGFHENQANALAGEIIKKYALSSSRRKRIYESMLSVYDNRNSLKS